MRHVNPHTIGGAQESTLRNADLDWVNECTEHSCDAQEWFVNCEYGIVDCRDRGFARVGVEETEERRKRFARGGRGRHRRDEEGVPGWDCTRERCPSRSMLHV